MQILFELFRYKILITAEGEFSPLQQWSQYTNSFSVSPSECRQISVDLVIDMRLEKGWKNDKDMASLHVTSHQNGDDLIAIEKPVLSGKYVRSSGPHHARLLVNADNSHSIDFAVTICLSLLLEGKNDMLVHSSCVMKNGEAWMFLGPGGAGKTTIALELNDGGFPMAVDKTLVSVGEDGKAYAISTPFNDYFSQSKTKQMAEIVGIVFIEQALAHQVQALSQWEAIHRMMRQVLSSSRERETVDRVLKIVGSVVEQVKFSARLKFAYDDRFWNQLLTGEDV